LAANEKTGDNDDKNKDEKKDEPTIAGDNKVINSNVPEQSPSPQKEKIIKKSRKRWGICLLLCLLLGWMGAHRFYAGRFVTGIIMICLIIVGFVFYIPFGIDVGITVIWVIIDLIRIICGKFTDKEGNPITRK